MHTQNPSLSVWCIFKYTRTHAHVMGKKRSATAITAASLLARLEQWVQINGEQNLNQDKVKKPNQILSLYSRHEMHMRRH